LPVGNKVCTAISYQGKNLVGNPEGKRPFGRTRRRWEDAIKIGLRERGQEMFDFIYLAHGRIQCRAVIGMEFDSTIS